MQFLKCKVINSERAIQIICIDKNVWVNKVSDILVKLVVNGENESVISYEVELSIKSEKRYKDIINDYLPCISKKHCNYVFWGDDTEAKRDKLREIFAHNRASEHHKFRRLGELKL